MIEIDLDNGIIKGSCKKKDLKQEMDKLRDMISAKKDGLIELNPTLEEYYNSNDDKIRDRFIKEHQQEYSEFCYHACLSPDCLDSENLFIESEFDGQKFLKILYDEYVEDMEDEAPCPLCENICLWRHEFETNYHWLQCKGCGWRTDEA